MQSQQGLSPVRTRTFASTRKARTSPMVCADGDFLSRILLPVVFIAARAQIAEIANIYRRQDAEPEKRPRRSKEQEAAVATLATFIDPSRESPSLFALNQTIVARGQGAFRLSALSAVHELLSDLGLMKVYRDTRDGRATAKRYRILDERAVEAMVAGLPLHALHAACRIVHRLPFARAAFARLADMTAWLEDRRWAWSSPRARLVEDVIAQCAELQVRGLSRGRRQPEAGCVLSRRLELIGAPIAGWDDATDTSDLPPLDDLSTPEALSGQGKTGRQASACGAPVFSEPELTQSVICEQDHNVTELPCNPEETSPMTNLTGRRVMTKEEQAAADRLRKQTAKAARAEATTSRSLGDMVAVTGPSETAVNAITAQGAAEGLSDVLIGEFIGKMRAYGWRGKTQKQVDDTVMLWFGERVANGSFRPKPAQTGPVQALDMLSAYQGLCGSSDVAKWRAMISASPAARFEDDAIASAAKIASAYASTQSEAAWGGVIEIGRRIGSCAYLFHIAELRVAKEGGLVVTVLHPSAEPKVEGVFATQGHADAVAGVIAALTGEKVVGVPSTEAWVRMSARDFVTEAF